MVEDHKDIRKFIRETLGDSYRYLEEENGRKGLATAIREVPDLIISDVMMPEMDGMEMCRQIKLSEISSHIPIILLTARAQQEDKLEGLEIGVYEYLSKPFSSKELRLRTQNVIQQQKKWNEKLFLSTNQSSTKDPSTSIDHAFLDKLKHIVLSHLKESQFGVEQLSAECNMSSVQLKRKLKSIIGINTVSYIQKCRMEYALELLEQDDLSIAQVAEEVGFEEASYFSKVFKKHFGYLPSEKR